MTYKLLPREREVVTKLPEEERFTYSLKRMADWGEVWTLRDEDGFALLSDGAHEVVPVWPHPEFALEYAHESSWAVQPTQVELSQFLEK